MSGKRVNNTATARLKQDYMRIMRDPVPYVKAVPLPSNILEWFVSTDRTTRVELCRNKTLYVKCFVTCTVLIMFR